MTVQDAIWLELFESDGGLMNLMGNETADGPPETTLPLRFESAHLGALEPAHLGTTGPRSSPVPT